jgi:hypothetical protein
MFFLGFICYMTTKGTRDKVPMTKTGAQGEFFFSFFVFMNTNIYFILSIAYNLQQGGQ